MTGGVNIHLNGCVSVLTPESAVCACLCVSVFVYAISNWNTSKKMHYMSDLSNFDALLHKTHSKVLLVLRYQDSTCVGP